MDTEILVDEMKCDGQRLVAELIKTNLDAIRAFWPGPSNDGRWFLYIVSKLVDEKGLASAYRHVYRILNTIDASWVSVSDVKLISPSNPAARDALEIQTRHATHIPTWTRRRQLGDMAIDEA